MDKLNPKIIAGVVVVLLVVAAVLMYVFIPRASAPAQAPAPSEDDTPLKPLKSATVLATKTGGGGGVSGYSFQREYAEGECTFTKDMNKYVTLTATLGIDTEDPRLPFVDKVKAIWKTESIEMSVVEVTLNPANQSLVLLIPATTKTAINIACDDSGTARTDNTIEILYSTKSSSGFAPPPKLWGTIRMVQGLGTEITSAFDSIPVGKGTELAVTLVAAGVGDVTTTQSIPYKFTVKGTSPPQVINPIYLQVVNTNTYIMTVGTASVTVKTRKKVLSSYADYVALQVESGSSEENIGDFISIQSSGTIMYKKYPPDDSCFFKIEMASQDCEYNWVEDGCTKTCGGGTKIEKAISIKTQPSGGGQSCTTPLPTRGTSIECNITPCPIDCVLSATGTQFADVPDATCSAKNCITPGTKQQMKILTQSSGGGKSCETVYSSLAAKTPVTTSVPCTLTCTVREVLNSRFTTGPGTETDFLVANGTWPAGVTTGSRLEVNGLAGGSARTVTLKVFPSSGSSLYQFLSPPLPTFATNQATVVKIVLTTTGQLKYSTKASATTGTWSASTAITPALSTTPQQYSLRIVEYVDSTSTTTKLEIGTVDAGVFTPKATYPSW